MTSTKNMTCPESPYSSPILKINFDGGKNVIFTHRDILLRVPAFSALVLELYNNNNALTTCPELMGISFKTFHVLYHYLNTGQYQSLKPLGATDADRWLHGFETALDVHRFATNINLPSLRDLACVELAKNSNNMNQESIFRAMGELKVTLADFPTLAACIKTREMYAKKQQARQEANTALSTHQSPDPRVQKALEDAKRRVIENGFEEDRNNMEALDAVMKCFADRTRKLDTTEDTPVADTDGPHPVTSRDVNTVSDDWDILSPTEVSEEEDFDLKSLAISCLNASNKRKLDPSKDNDKKQP
ncbi:Ff.00g101940.m01.CDS01 [Fusarium sp. VM40]|nr:Ff.00g101940.m01.CDS01 [Fusarium sp. VM40]